MLFQIQPSSGIAIYRQIIGQVKRMVISGVLKPGDELPSVRQLASELEVNPMTISKAYSMLEETGYLERLRGKGMIISDKYSGDNTTERKMQLLKPAIDELMVQARQIGLSKEELIKEINNIREDDNE